MSSHREAPEISKDPVADSTDVYAFVSPDQPDTVTLIANYVPLQLPDGGPNFYEFGDDVLYKIHIDNNGDGQAEIVYEFRFETVLDNPDTFLYNTGPIGSIYDPNWNRKQFYSVTRVDEQGQQKLLARHLSTPPCNIGPFSTPNYIGLAQEAIYNVPGGIKVFAGQRQEGFYVDLGAVFDLLDLRPFQNLHVASNMVAASGVNGTKNVNVNSIALQIPIHLLTSDGSTPTAVDDPHAVIGVWTSASRRKVIMRNNDGREIENGPWVQVSRLANPLFNEVLIPLIKKDYWNSQPPAEDQQFAQYAEFPEVSRLLPILYPGVFPNLAALNASRADIVAILLTGIPFGLIPGFQNYTGKTMADLQRLNLAIPPATNPNILGLLGSDLAGFPNGRRVFDDVFTIELRALAGVTYPLIDKTYTPDAAASQVTDGITSANSGFTYLSQFPYLGTPYSGYSTPSN